MEANESHPYVKKLLNPEAESPANLVSVIAYSMNQYFEFFPKKQEDLRNLRIKQISAYHPNINTGVMKLTEEELGMLGAVQNHEDDINTLEFATNIFPQLEESRKEALETLVEKGLITQLDFESGPHFVLTEMARQATYEASIEAFYAPKAVESPKS